MSKLFVLVCSTLLLAFLCNSSFHVNALDSTTPSQQRASFPQNIIQVFIQFIRNILQNIFGKQFLLFNKKQNSHGKDFQVGKLCFRTEWHI